MEHRCHNCGGFGHLQRQCTVSKRFEPKEVRERNHNERKRSNRTNKAVKAEEVKQVSLRTLTVSYLVVGSLVEPKIERTVLFESQKVNAGISWNRNLVKKTVLVQ